MARIYCPQCGSPVARRTTICLQCEATIAASVVAEKPVRSLIEWCAIVTVALLCLAFVVVLGLTGVFREGGGLVGALLLLGIVASVRWVSYLEKGGRTGDQASD